MKIVDASPEVMGGTPVFTGTHVPVQTLIDYLAADDSINEFLSDFPTVSAEQVVGVLDQGLVHPKSLAQEWREEEGNSGPGG